MAKFRKFSHLTAFIICSIFLQFGYSTDEAEVRNELVFFFFCEIKIYPNIFILRRMQMDIVYGMASVEIMRIEVIFPAIFFQHIFIQILFESFFQTWTRASTVVTRDQPNFWTMKDVKN